MAKRKTRPIAPESEPETLTPHAPASDQPQSDATLQPDAPNDSPNDSAPNPPPEPKMLKFGQFEVDPADLSPIVREHLMQYGFAKTLQDAAAGTKGEASKLWLGPRDDKAEVQFQSWVEKVGSDYDSAESFAKACQLSDQQARFDAILAGTIGQPRASAPRVRGIDKVMQSVAEERLKAAISARKIKVSRDTLKGLVSDYLSKNMTEVRAEAERRLAATADIDLDSLDGLDDEDMSNAA